MRELTPARCFVVRLYRLDPESPDQMAGQVEAMDGSGARTQFTDLRGLADALQHQLGTRPRRRKSGSQAKEQSQS